MELTINSKTLGQPVTFSRPGNQYIYWDINGQPGTLGKQPTHLGGATLTYSGDDENEFKRICRNWYRSYIREMQNA